MNNSSVRQCALQIGILNFPNDTGGRFADNYFKVGEKWPIETEVTNQREYG